MLSMHRVLSFRAPASLQVKDLSRRKPHRPTLPSKLFEDVSALIQDCWAEVPAHRPDFREISARIDAWEPQDIERYWDESTQKRTKRKSFSARLPANESPAKNKVLHKVLYAAVYAMLVLAAIAFRFPFSFQDP